MRNIYRSLLLLLVGATQKELARHVRYLKVENQILRSKLPARVIVTRQERNRLVRFGPSSAQPSMSWSRSSIRTRCAAGFGRAAKSGIGLARRSAGNEQMPRSRS
jgi:hypothetical protein